LSAKNFAKEVENTQEGCLVYFTTLDKEKEIGKEWKSFNTVYKMVENAVKVLVFRIDPESEDFN